MNRLQFLRTAILAAIATPVLLPEILKEQPKITWQEIPTHKSIGYRYDKDELFFKKREIKSVKVGFEDDDFAKNTYTVKVMFV